MRDLVRGWRALRRVDQSLALAIAWQESGWQQQRVSSAGAIGVMQVMPDTGRWMRWYAGRKLRLHDPTTTSGRRDDAADAAGVDRARQERDRGVLPGPRCRPEHGYFKDTKHYVESVRAPRPHHHTHSPV